jgi:acetyl esterase
MKWNALWAIVPPLLLCATLLHGAGPTDSLAISGPAVHIYAVHDSTELRAYVFSPTEQGRGTRAAIVVFHGGGWNIGEAAWAFPLARHFAETGMVGIAAEYRLSDQKTITPLEAMADARAVIRWVRSDSESLGVDTERIAAYGWSAGAHLAACAAIFDDVEPNSPISSSPNALILESPGVSLLGDRWFRRLLLGRADVRSVSPDEHVRGGLPPTLVLQGDLDTVAPLAGVERFCRRMQEAGNRCELRVYEGYGHLFTPASMPDDGWPQPDPKIKADAMRRTDEFLRSLGFMR